MDGQKQDSLLGRWRARLSRTLLRDPAIVLLEMDGDAAVRPRRAPPRDAWREGRA